MKSVIIPFGLLVSISTLLLLYQWSFVNESKDEERSSSEELDIAIAVKEERIEVVYTFEHMRPGVYQLSPPANTIDITCEYENEDNCRVVKKDENYQVNQENDQPITLHYTLPWEGDPLLSDWMLNVTKNGEPLPWAYVLTINDYTDLEQTWVAPMAKEADIALENVRYHQFESTSGTPPLLLLSEEMDTWQLNQSVVVYDGSQSLPESLRGRLKQFISTFHPSIVQLDHTDIKIKGSYVATSGRDIDMLAKERFTSHLQKMTAGENGWVMAVLQELFYPNERTPLKVKKKAEEIKATLTEQQMKSLQRKLLENEEASGLASYADKSLSDIYGLKTTYFQQNDQDTTLPLYFTHNQPGHFEKKDMEVSVRVHRGSRYYPLTPIVNAAGYKMTTLEEGLAYRVMMPTKDYRFYVHQTTFILNEESFGIGEDMVKQLGGQLHIKEKYLDELLEITVKEKEASFSLQKK